MLLSATMCRTSWGLRGAMGQSIGRRGGGRTRRWRTKFVDVWHASTMPARNCWLILLTRRGNGSPRAPFGGLRRRLLTATASLAIRRSRSAGSRSWAPTGRRRRRRRFVVEIGRFVARVVVHLDRSRFQACECHQLYALARNVDAEPCRSSRMDAIGAGIRCCKRWEDASTENEDVRAPCQVPWNEDCRISMG